MATERARRQVAARYPHRERNTLRRSLRLLREEPGPATVAGLGLEPIEGAVWRARIETEPALRAMADGTDPLARSDDFKARVDELASQAHVLRRRLDGDL